MSIHMDKYPLASITSQLIFEWLTIQEGYLELDTPQH